MDIFLKSKLKQTSTYNGRPKRYTSVTTPIITYIAHHSYTKKNKENKLIDCKRFIFIPNQEKKYALSCYTYCHISSRSMYFMHLYVRGMSRTTFLVTVTLLNRFSISFYVFFLLKQQGMCFTRAHWKIFLTKTHLFVISFTSI